MVPYLPASLDRKVSDQDHSNEKAKAAYPVDSGNGNVFRSGLHGSRVEPLYFKPVRFHCWDTILAFVLWQRTFFDYPRAGFAGYRQDCLLHGLDFCLSGLFSRLPREVST